MKSKNKKNIRLEERFVCEYYNFPEHVMTYIERCEGDHRQQVAYSSFHHAITQICFGCKRIRTNLE
jgi:hypothetical protein